MTESVRGRLCTARLELVAADAVLARADAACDRVGLGRLLGAAVPPEWPPPLTLDVLSFWADTLCERPEQCGWWNWYFVRNVAAEPRALVGGGGFCGPPSADGTVVIGYSVLEPFQGNGYATEAMRRLLEWAWSHPAVQRVTADTFAHLPQSIRVLNKLGFVSAGAGEEEGALRFCLSRRA